MVKVYYFPKMFNIVKNISYIFGNERNGTMLVTFMLIFYFLSVRNILFIIYKFMLGTIIKWA